MMRQWGVFGIGLILAGAGYLIGGSRLSAKWLAYYLLGIVLGLAWEQLKRRRYRRNAPTAAPGRVYVYHCPKCCMSLKRYSNMPQPDKIPCAGLGCNDGTMMELEP